MLTLTNKGTKKRKRQNSFKSVDPARKLVSNGSTSSTNATHPSKQTKKIKKDKRSSLNSDQLPKKIAASETAVGGNESIRTLEESSKKKKQKLKKLKAKFTVNNEFKEAIIHAKKKKRKNKFLSTDLKGSDSDDSDPPSTEETNISKPNDTAVKSKIVPLKTTGFCWNADAKLLAKVIEPSQVSESSEDEDEDVSKKKKKRQTVAEKREAAKKEEQRLRAIEESLASNRNVPSSCDEFDRAVLSNPDSSELWLQYMAFHLQATEIEKARAVAQRALKTISYRKEQEKFNIWVGLLNLENLYGTQDTLKKTLSEALQLNDAYKVRVQMINIYSENGKLQELESEIKLVTKKFRDNKDMWLEVGTILYKHGHIEHARRLLQQGLAAQRNKNETVGLISKFAMMEANLGQMERALALFDSILVNHPQRVDVWSVCVDQLCKAGMIEQARSTLDRAISQKLKSRWMKILFAKYLTFEEKFGSPEGSERVRQRAREYVERVGGEKLDD